MIEPTERQKFLLALVVHEYARTAAPVGSRFLVEQYELDMSSATVRNELAALTELGYLRQPHTSAGRIPTEEGYRFFVGRLLQETSLPENVRRTITHQFYQMRHDVDQWMRLAASILAVQSRAASLVTAPHPEKARLKHLELISTRGRQVLMVLVLVGGEVRQRLITLPEPVRQDVLSQTAHELTLLLENRDAEGVRQVFRQPGLHPLQTDILSFVGEDMGENDALASGEVYLDGMTNMLSEPEYASTDEARKALRVLEERSTLQDLLSRTVLSSSGGSGVQVLIGGEGTYEELRSSSLVLARYGHPGTAFGALGVLGPMRMAYGRTISAMRFLAGLLSDLVAETLASDEPRQTS